MSYGLFRSGGSRAPGGWPPVLWCGGTAAVFTSPLGRMGTTWLSACLSSQKPTPTSNLTSALTGQQEAGGSWVVEGLDPTCCLAGPIWPLDPPQPPLGLKPGAQPMRVDLVGYRLPAPLAPVLCEPRMLSRKQESGRAPRAGAAANPASGPASLLPLLCAPQPPG